MIRFGIIGTNFITRTFLEHMKEVHNVTVTAVYSRVQERADMFASEYKIEHTFTDLNEMAKSNVIDAIYIASPNSLHYEQTLLFLNHQKHVLCEKPFASNEEQVTEMIKVAKEQDVVLMEALRNMFMPNFKVLQQQLHKVGTIRRAILNKSQYSSRYDLYKNGDNPNTFNPEFSNGSLMDLGVYCLGPALKLFGLPTSTQANAVLLDSGVDGSGSIILSYEEKEVIVLHSKISDSKTPTEIIGENGRILIDDISSIDEIIFEPRKGENEELSIDQGQAHMSYEIREFVRLIEEKLTESSQHTYEDMINLSKTMSSIRRHVGVHYPTD